MGITDKLVKSCCRSRESMLLTRLSVGVAGAHAGVTTAFLTPRSSSLSVAKDCGVSVAISSGSRTSASARRRPCSADHSFYRRLAAGTS